MDTSVYVDIRQYIWISVCVYIYIHLAYPLKLD